MEEVKKSKDGRVGRGGEEIKRKKKKKRKPGEILKNKKKKRYERSDGKERCGCMGFTSIVDIKLIILMLYLSNIDDPDVVVYINCEGCK